MGRDLALICNPTSGRGKAGRLLPEATERLQSLGCDVEVLTSSSAEHATELAAASAAKHEAVVALGGDGMVSLVANGVLGSDAVFGIIPSGSGNDFATHVGYPKRDLAGACTIIASGDARAIDVGRMNDGRVFLCVAGAGFDSLTNEAANKVRWARGTMVYVVAVFKTLAHFKPIAFTIRLDGSEERFNGMFVAVGNARSYGGGMLIAPNAVLDDGLFDICIVREMSRTALFGQFPRLFKGTHVNHRAVEIRRARQVELSAERPLTLYADGERAIPLPVTLTIEPKALRVLAP